MNINKINQNCTTEYKAALSFKADTNPIDKPKRKVKNTQMLALTLGGLGTIGIANFLILRKKKLPTKPQIEAVTQQITHKPKLPSIEYAAEFVSSEITQNNEAYNYLKRNTKGFYLKYGREINTFLRTGKLKEPPKMTDDIPENIRDYVQAEITKIKDTNRAIVDSVEMLDKRFTSNTQRPMTVYRDAPKSWLDTAENRILTDKGYCSTSLTPGASMEGMIGSDAANNVRYEIRLPEGTNYLDLTNTTEQEILLPRNSKFKVIGDNILELIL